MASLPLPNCPRFVDVETVASSRRPSQKRATGFVLSAVGVAGLAWLGLACGRSGPNLLRRLEGAADLGHALRPDSGPFATQDGGSAGDPDLRAPVPVRESGLVQDAELGGAGDARVTPDVADAALAADLSAADLGRPFDAAVEGGTTDAGPLRNEDIGAGAPQDAAVDPADSRVTSPDSLIPDLSTSIPDASADLMPVADLASDVGLLCGNHVLDPNEDCDDGNRVEGDGCSSLCQYEAVCGNGIVELGEQCDRGSLNEDKAAFEVWQNAAQRITIHPVQRWIDATSFYALLSASSHTGFEAVEVSNLFFYRNLNSGLLSLFVIHGIDRSTSGIRQPESHVQISISDVPLGSHLALSDDNGSEFWASDPITYVGNWRFRDNTDGGVISAIAFPGAWTLRIEASFVAGIRDWRWADDRGFIYLDPTKPVFATLNDTPSACRTDCRVPRCGDGFLDGGEVCDDGNRLDGDGCSRGCTTVP